MDEQRTLVGPDDCPTEAANLLKPDEDFEKRFIRTALGTAVGVDDWRLLSVVVAAVEELRIGAASLATPERRSAGDRVQVSTAVIYQLDYSFRGRQYRAWLPSDNCPVYAPVSPLTERTMGLVEDALTAWEKGDRRTALRSLRMTLDMGKKCNYCRSSLERRRTDIPDGLYDEAGKFDLMHWLGNLFR